MTHKNRF